MVFRLLSAFIFGTEPPQNPVPDGSPRKNRLKSTIYSPSKWVSAGQETTPSRHFKTNAFSQVKGLETWRFGLIGDCHDVPCVSAICPNMT